MITPNTKDPMVVYAIGGPNSPETNQWLHMTACKATAEELRAAIEGGTMKEIKMTPRTYRKKGGPKNGQ